MSVQPMLPENESSPMVQDAKQRLDVCHRLSIAFGLLGFVFSAYSGWWLIAALSFQLGMIISAVWGMTYIARARASSGMYVTFTFFMVIALVLMFSTSIQIIFMDQTNQFADCTRHALTIVRQEQCKADLEDNLLGSLLK
ncbi:hypothetical protein ACN08X_05210 [Rothia sp. P6271]|uniref:hypothetical protein n=1 Tax=unclassified Rothia (in: high G+C Gram-positive bacteria) TaxID=2689056 RepID=UPI003AD1CA3E